MLANVVNRRIIGPKWAIGRMTFRNETMGSRAWIESTPGVSVKTVLDTDPRVVAPARLKGSSDP